MYIITARIGNLGGGGVCVAILQQALLFFPLKFSLLASVPTVSALQKLLRPLVKRWRSMSHCSFDFLDDGISEHPERVSASAASLLY